MHLHALDYVLWVITPCLQVWVLVFLRRRGLVYQFPFFYWYTIFQVASDLYLLATERVSYRLYFYSYWIAAAISVLFTFALIDELFRIAFRNLAAIRNLGSYVFRWGTGILLLAACINAFSSSSDTRFVGVSGTILLVDRTARAMLCLLALLLLLGARSLRIPARSTLFGITLGFVIYMFSKVLLDTIAIKHFQNANVITRMSAVAYLTSCLLWLLYTAYGVELPAQAEIEASPGSIIATPSLIDSINAMVEHSMRSQGRTS